MPLQPKLSKDEILDTLRNLADRLGKQTLSKGDIHRNLNGLISHGSISRYFGSLGNALEKAGLQRFDQQQHKLKLAEQARIGDDELFTSLAEVENAIGREPTKDEYTSVGKFSESPFRRFGGWRTTLEYYRKWKTESGMSLPSDPTIASVDSPQLKTTRSPSVREGVAMSIERPMQSSKREHQIYGELINFRGLIHGPVNEQGVVYLFGMVSRELGFNIEAVQIAYPDCEGKVLSDRQRGLWRKVFIEFEFKASNFKQHGHDHTRCDYIICWENDWPDAPVEVIELRTEILKLPST